jgi:hypothetical protein
MENVMRAHLTLIAAMFASASAAEPPKSAPAQPAPLPQHHAVVLAAADAPHSPVPEAAQPSPAPAKRRVARITTCRCGDPQPTADNEEQ